jgi:hypothetical protein
MTCSLHKDIHFGHFGEGGLRTSVHRQAAAGGRFPFLLGSCSASLLELLLSLLQSCKKKAEASRPTKAEVSTAIQAG